MYAYLRVHVCMCVHEHGDLDAVTSSLITYGGRNVDNSIMPRLTFVTVAILERFLEMTHVHISVLFIDIDHIIYTSVQHTLSGP